MKNNRTLYMILYLLLGTFLITKCPSGRQKSRVQQSTPQKMASQKSEPVMAKQSLTTPQLPTVTPEKEEGAELAEELEAEENEAIDQTEDTDSSEGKAPSLPTLFKEKIIVSANLTKKIIDYFLNAATHIVSNVQSNDTIPLDEKLRTLFNGLRYPIHRHLREIVSACNDKTSFWCGSVLKHIMLAQADPLIKKNFIEAFNQLSKALKNFKIYHIDAELRGNIDTQVNTIKTKIDMLKKAAAQAPTLNNIATIEISLLNDYYLDILLYIKDFLDKDTLNKHLPHREGVIKYGYRGARKVAGASGKFVLGKAYSYLASQTLKKVGSFLKGRAIDSNALSKIIPGAVKGAGELLWNYGGFLAYSYLWIPYINEAIIPLINQNTFLRLQLYLYKIPQLAKELDNKTLREINEINFDLMEKSSEFIASYLFHLAQAILFDPELPIESVAQSLQSSQIEIFRHRRLIISELSNDKAFTANYFTFLHNQYLVEHNKQFNPTELSNYKEKIVLSSETNEDGEIERYFKVTPEGTDLVNKLTQRSSKDPANKDDLIKLSGPLKIAEIKIIVQKFETIRAKIINELKAWGARSSSQLIQNYWLSVIDQDYSKKLNDHLTNVVSDTKALKYALEPLMVKNEFGKPLLYDDNEPVTLPLRTASPYAAQTFNHILEQFYIKPLTIIADILSKEPIEGLPSIHDRLPQGKNWFIKYPLLYAKLGVKFNTFVAKKAADQGLIPLTIAYFTGGASAVSTEILKMGSFSGLTSLLIGVDINDFSSTLHSWETLKSGWKWLPSWGARGSDMANKAWDVVGKGLTIKQGIEAISDIKSAVTRPIKQIINQ